MENVESKVALLKLVYDNVKIVNNRLAYICQGNEIILMDIDGNQIRSWIADKHKLLGIFLITMSDSIVNIYNCDNDKSVTLDTKVYFDCCKIDNLGDKFLSFTNGYRIMILNNSLQFVMDMQEVSECYVNNIVNGKITLEYKLNSGESHYMQFDEASGNLVYIDKETLTDGVDIIGVAMEPDRFAVNRLSIPSVRYSLSNNNMQAISAGYSDITPLITGKYYKTYNRINGDIYEGIIDRYGKEILPTAYNSIMKFGKDSFILSRGRLRYLFSLEKGFLISNIDKQMFNKHQTLPIIIVCVANVFYICNKENKIFNFENFTSEYKCYQCEEDSSLLRVEFEREGFLETKYVTRQLTPVTNIKSVAQAKNFTWTQITGG